MGIVKRHSSRAPGRRQADRIRDFLSRVVLGKLSRGPQNTPQIHSWPKKTSPDEGCEGCAIGLATHPFGQPNPLAHNSPYPTAPRSIMNMLSKSHHCRKETVLVLLRKIVFVHVLPQKKWGCLFYAFERASRVDWRFVFSFFSVEPRVNYALILLRTYCYV